jgi:pyrroline-5-carboxylate reductase
MAARLGILGFGSMGGAIARGAVGAGVIDARDVIVVEPDDARRAAASALGCVVSGVERHAFDAEQVLIAVKPQRFRQAVARIGAVESPTVIISVMAGVSSATIRHALGGATRVIRAMPNIACEVGAGATALAPGEAARPGDESLALSLFAAVGRVVVVDESMLHAVTALSGSGPAYVFLLAEAMEQAGIQAGLERHLARTLAYETVHGAAKLLVGRADQDADSLRRAVTSPGGTTSAALEVMFERELPQIVAEAILAARDRSIEFGERL